MAVMITADTIAAISSSIAPAARIIVRTSGSLSFALSEMFGASLDSNSSAEHREIAFAGLTLPAWIYRFRGPHSYTAEDIVEYHIPGNPVLAKLLLNELLARGARAAEAGEFTARAFFNGKMDLTGAEGVAAVISAQNQRELAAARQLLAGELANRLRPVLDVLAETLALVEVGIDFVEEDVSFLSRNQQRTRVQQADEALARLLVESTRFERLAHEPQVVLIGRPNAGKSTLLNALAGRQRAVVSATAGTTRDMLTAEVMLPRGMIRVTDVAGIDSLTPLSEIEREMRSQALIAADSADVIVLVRDLTDSEPVLASGRAPSLVLRTKLDLMPSASVDQGLGVSALTGAGMEQLRGALDAVCFGDAGTGSSLAVNLRHVRAIAEARAALGRAIEAIDNAGPEVIAMELREAIDAVGSILGRVTPDELLGRIFAGFCIGK